MTAVHLLGHIVIGQGHDLVPAVPCLGVVTDRVIAVVQSLASNNHATNDAAGRQT